MIQAISPKKIIGVMGKGNLATPLEIKGAYELGKLIAENGWILLTGGRNVGVMDAASLGAKSAGGLTIGILPGKDKKEVSFTAGFDDLVETGFVNRKIL